MSTQDKYESRIRKAAQLDGLENGLRDGGKCLICRCWKKPCGNCAKRGGAGPAATPQNGKSAAYRQAAARLGGA